MSQPGGFAAIAGENFGAQRGTVVARLRKWTGFHKDVPLRVNDWSPTLIEISWPWDIDGVRDQTDVTVEVTHANKTAKASWKVFFRAETDYKLLPASRVRVVTCGDDGNYNTCNGTSRVGDSCGVGPDAVGHCGGSFSGYHFNCPAAVGNDRGDDEFEVRLNHGWAISGVDFQRSKGGGGVESFADSSSRQRRVESKGEVGSHAGRIHFVLCVHSHQWPERCPVLAS